MRFNIGFVYFGAVFRMILRFYYSKYGVKISKNLELCPICNNFVQSKFNTCGPTERGLYTCASGQNGDPVMHCACFALQLLRA